jgi:sphinganine-1-phosphate aldolase
MKTIVLFPEKSMDKNAVLQSMAQIQRNDQEWKTGRMFGFIFHADDETSKLLEQAYMNFAHLNRLNPTSFPSLRKFETEIVSMCADLLHGDVNVVGSATSGGTESIIMSVLVAREIARDKNFQDFKPELVLPVTAHPAFLKACHYLNIKPRIIPVREDKRADVDKMEEAINNNTIMLVASAPCFPFGVVDPVEQISTMAEKRKILCHVDACMGGFMLPFMKEYSVPPFDFSLPGVTSVSLDAHKFGYAMKGVSIILYRNPEMRKKQFFVYSDWPGGIFASTAMLGSRSGGPLAGAWAMMKYLGKEGYREVAKKVMDATRKVKSAVEEIPGLKIISNPDMSILAIASEHQDIFSIGDMLEEKGWHLDRQQIPDSLHLTISWGNVSAMDDFIHDLHEVMSPAGKLRNESKMSNLVVRVTKRASEMLPGKTIGRLAMMFSGKTNKKTKSHAPRQAALYGLTGSLTSRTKVTEAILEMMDEMYRL